MENKFRCIRGLLTIVLVGIITVSFAGCKRPPDIKPAIGPTVVKETENNVDISSQTRLTVKIQSGSVKITRGTQNKLQIIEETSLKGPANKEYLNQILNGIKSTVETTSMSVSINNGAEKELRPLYRYNVDMELIVPETLKLLYIDAENATITLSGLEEMSKVELSLERGLIDVNRCSSDKISVSVDNGDICMKDITGNGTYKCGRGDITFTGLKGVIDLKSLAGDSIIENTEGKLNCDISAGSLTVRESKMERGSVLYASNGMISAELEGIDSEGTYTIKSSAGDIRVKLPKKAGWSMSAKSTRGRVKNHIDPIAETLETGTDGEVYGDVNGGGPLIDIYVDMGNIILN